jgi:hypothetical protein
MISIRRCLAGLVIAGMLMHASLVPLHLSMRLANAATAALDTLIAASICSADGNTHPAGESQPANFDHCSICIGMASFQIMTPPDTTWAETLLPQSTAIDVVETEKRVRLVKLSALSRGPPSLV